MCTACLYAPSSKKGLQEGPKLARCHECGSELPDNRRCQFCDHSFCEEHWPSHLAREKRYEGLAEDASKLWKKREVSA